jgi:hypothetical protein
VSSNRSLFLIGGGIVALSIVAVLVVLLAGDRESVEFADDTPEAALQRYLAAFDEGDLGAAHAYFSDDVRDQMDLAAFQRAVNAERGFSNEGTRRALFDGRTGEGDSVRLELTIEEFTGQGLGASSYRYQAEVPMVRDGDAWRIDAPLVWLNPAPLEPDF